LGQRTAPPGGTLSGKRNTLEQEGHFTCKGMISSSWGIGLERATQQG
jgi:hypothetical protein